MNAFITTSCALFLTSALIAAEKPRDLLGDLALPEGQSVVLELFTSQGCSSCPPAEKLCNQLLAEARAKNIPITLMAWHVDYWDKLKTKHGVWKDTFSSPDYTKRQLNYARLHQKAGLIEKARLVTPQVLLNGHPIKGGMSFQDALSEAAEKTTSGVTAKVGRDGATVTISAIAGLTVEAPFLLQVAITEGGMTRKITAGENHGVSLDHEGVVRVSQGKRVSDISELDEAISLTLPDDYVGTNAEVIVLIQNAADGGIVHNGVFALPSDKQANLEPSGLKELIANDPFAALMPIVSASGDAQCVHGACVFIADLDQADASEAAPVLAADE